MKIKKIFSRINRSFIYKLDGLNTKLYVKKYDKWLKKNGVDINGKIKYIHHSVFLDGTDYSKIHLGDKIVMSVGCILLVHDFSLEAGMIACGEGSENEAYFLKDVYIGNNCFVGAKSIILCGARIGNNCIIGAGSVVPGKVFPDNSIIAGNPAKIIGNTIDWAQRKKKENEFKRGFYN